jgi:hypothetical protein
MLGSSSPKPVMFPPGCARLGTKPWPTGSATPTKTMGIVRVACRIAANDGVRATRNEKRRPCHRGFVTANGRALPAEINPHKGNGKGPGCLGPGPPASLGPGGKTPSAGRTLTSFTSALRSSRARTHKSRRSHSLSGCRPPKRRIAVARPQNQPCSTIGVYRVRGGNRCKEIL